MPGGLFMTGITYICRVCGETTTLYREVDYDEETGEGEFDAHNGKVEKIDCDYCLRERTHVAEFATTVDVGDDDE